MCIRLLNSKDMIELVFLCCYFVFEKKKSIQTFQIKFNFFFIAYITFLRRSSNNRTRILLVRILVVLSLVLETIEVVEKWKVIRLSFIREEKGTQDSFESNKLDSKFHVCHRETKWNWRKITREICENPKANFI